MLVERVRAVTRHFEQAKRNSGSLKPAYRERRLAGLVGHPRQLTPRRCGDAPRAVSGSWISDAIGRRASIALTCAIAGVAMSLAGYWNDFYLGGFSVFYLMIMVQQLFGSGSY